MLYYQPKGITDPNAGYIDGDPQQGIKGSVIPAGAVEFPQREIVNCITKGGHVPSSADIYQLTRSVRRALFAWGIDTGSANALSIALDPPLTAYAQGLEVRVFVGNDNTSATTIRINGLSTQQIIKKDGSTLVPGDLKRGGVAILVYDGSNFQLTSGAAGSTTITGGWFNGADYIIDTGTPNHIIGTPVVVPANYNAGQSFLVLVANTNTGPTDINVAGLGVRPLLRPKGEQLGAGDIIPTMLIRISYDGSNFVMLSPIHAEIIQITITRIVGPNAGADFPDLIAAMEWVSRRKIDDGGSLILQLQNQSTGSPLVHSYNKSIILDHPQGNRIYILGGPMNSIPSSISPGTGNIRADAAAQLALWRAAFPAEIRFAPGFNLVIRRSFALLQNFLVTGDIDTGIASAEQGGIFAGPGTTVNVDTVCSANHAVCWNIWGASVYARNLYASGAGGVLLFVSYAGSLVVSPKGTGPNAGDPAGLVVPMSGGNTYVMMSCSLRDGVVVEHDSNIEMNTITNGPRVLDVANIGITAVGSTYCHMPAAVVTRCGSTGIWVADGANGQFTYSNVQLCAYGFLAVTGSSINATGSLTLQNTYADYYASCSMIDASNRQNAAAQSTPTFGTIGNGNAFIIG